jgi:tRNA-Thr(GGU) m(6)t(6)A37 methyltransferase TsaA
MTLYVPDGSVRTDIRPGERAVPWTDAQDAGLVYIGRIATPWTTLHDCPRAGRLDGPLCRIEVFRPWAEALDGLFDCPQTEVLYWLHRSRRDLVRQSPRNDGVTYGTFSIRTPNRPNPIGTSIVKLEGREGDTLLVRGLDCLDGTPLLDLKPDRALFLLKAHPTPGDAHTG